MAKIRHKKITLEQLARMVKRGFDQIAKDNAEFKQDFNEFKKYTTERFDSVHSDLHDIKITLGPLAHVAAAHDAEIRNLQARVSRLERKVGISR